MILLPSLLYNHGVFGWFVNSGEFDSKDKSPELTLRLNKGETSAIEELYSLYFDRLYSLVYNHVGMDHGNAEEVVQETWLAVVKSVKKFKGQSQPYTWLCSIAWHKIRDFQRLHYRDVAKLQRLSTANGISELQLIDTSPLPAVVIEQEETKELVRIALASLPVHYEQVLTLKYIEGMSAKEISQVLNKSAKSVESLLDRARLVLRNEIIQISKEYKV